jgi:hypothetical protein
LNIGLLVGGFGIGQGAVFAVQTWLVVTGAFDLLSSFGTHFSFAVLGILLIDGGSTTVLARHVAIATIRQQPSDSVWRVFWETSAFRMLVASLVNIAAAVYAIEISSSGFTRSYVLFALPGCLVWAGNAVGLLDGLKLSGISGITGSIAYATSALGLALAPLAPPDMAGSILGGAFSLGYVLTVAAQWAALQRYGWFPRFEKITRAGLVRSFKDGLALLLQFLPGQIILRVQLVLSTVYLGSESTALYIYAKQIVAASTQVIAFGSRVDFPELVQTTLPGKKNNFRDMFHAQRMTVGCAILAIGGIIAICLTAPLAPQSNFSKAAGVLLSLAPSILSISALLVMMQVVAASGSYLYMGLVVTATAVVGMAVSYLLVEALGIYAFLAGEVVYHVLAFSLLYLHIRDLSRRRPMQRGTASGLPS